MTSLLLLAALAGINVIIVATDETNQGPVFHNEWAVEITNGEKVARSVVEQYGFTFIGQVGKLKDTYRIRKDNHHRRSKRQAVDVTKLLQTDSRVLWVEQQETHFHVKRDLDIRPHDETGDSYVPPFNDPMFPKQWYLHNNGQNSAQPGVDMNLAPVWKLGIMGKGVVVSIVDDGVDGTHSDLAANYDPMASWDFNGNDANPHPDDSIEAGTRNNHGTRCAGEVAAAANNSICGVGVAPEASIGGIRFLDGDVTDSMEADALTYHNQHIDIYSCCWGPADDGKTMRTPGKLMTAAIKQGSEEGRNGNGSIFVWASGNGGNHGDDCGADGYVGDIHTISVGSINDKGASVYFMEKCPSTMAVVLSGGASDNKLLRTNSRPTNLVITTDIHDQCIDNFVGTSSAAPLAAGLIALLLQANPSLTWRDVQHIIAGSAHIPNAIETAEWYVNGAGYHVNEKFGFGMMDAGKMVESALTWVNVGVQRRCEVEKIEFNSEVVQGSSISLKLEVDCPQIGNLEHTVVHVAYASPRRGDISLTIVSPMNTPSELLSARPNDDSTAAVDFAFMSVRNWGEAPGGSWRLEMRYHPSSPGDQQPKSNLPDIPRRKEGNTARLISVGMTLYGTAEFDQDDAATTVAVKPGRVESHEVVALFNEEQLENEEIQVETEDLADGAKIPPNIKHNLDADKEGIDTGKFDGILHDPVIRTILEEYITNEEELDQRGPRVNGNLEDFRSVYESYKKRKKSKEPGNHRGGFGGGDTRRGSLTDLEWEEAGEEAENERTREELREIAKLLEKKGQVFV